MVPALLNTCSKNKNDNKMVSENPQNRGREKNAKKTVFPFFLTLSKLFPPKFRGLEARTANCTELNFEKRLILYMAPPGDVQESRFLAIH